MARRKSPLWYRILKKIYYDGRYIGLTAFVAVVALYVMSNSFGDWLTNIHPTMASSIETELQELTIATQKVLVGPEGSSNLGLPAPDLPPFRVLGAGIQGLFEVAPRSQYVKNLKIALLNYAHSAWRFIRAGLLLWLETFRLIADLLRLNSPHLYPKLRIVLLTLLACFLVILVWQPVFVLDRIKQKLNDRYERELLLASAGLYRKGSHTPLRGRALSARAKAVSAQLASKPSRAKARGSAPAPSEVTETTRSKSPAVEIRPHPPKLPKGAHAKKITYDVVYDVDERSSRRDDRSSRRE